MSESIKDEFFSADVLIVGGGIAGTALAARLAPLGWSIVLVERSAGVIDTARGDHLQPYTVELLDRWGILQRFMTDGAEKRKGTVWKSVDGEVLLDGAVDGLGIPHPYYLYLNHERISEVFLSVAAENPGFRLLRPASFQTLVSADDAPKAILRGADKQTITINAGMIVGADGRQSRVRSAASIECERYDYENPFAIVFAKPSQLDPRHDLIAYACDCGSVLVVPRTGGGWKLGVPVPRSDLKFWHKATAEEILEWFGSRLPDIQFTEPSQASFYPVQRVSALQWVKKNVVVIGDACHAMHPARGQGINIALRCVDQLTSALKTCGDTPDRHSLCQSARDYESRTAPKIRVIEEENHRQGMLMDDAGTMPVSAVEHFLRSIAGDPERLMVFRLELAGYDQSP